MHEKLPKQLNFTLLMKKLEVDEVITEEYSQIQTALIEELEVLFDFLSESNFTVNQEWIII